jgi:hypothetical protein
LYREHDVVRAGKMTPVTIAYIKADAICSWATR